MVLRSCRLSTPTGLSGCTCTIIHAAGRLDRLDVLACVQVNSDEAGAGFAEVGALSEAKDALREAVQLPLQHPRLFQKGSLAR